MEAGDRGRKRGRSGVYHSPLQTNLIRIKGPVSLILHPPTVPASFKQPAMNGTAIESVMNAQASMFAAFVSASQYRKLKP